MGSMRQIAPLRRCVGDITVPGDKSISHRALMLGALAQGKTRISGLAPGADVRCTLEAIRALGVSVTDEGKAVIIDGRGIQALHLPPRIDCGNSGTTARLLSGMLAGAQGQTLLIGDASLSRRPMRRVVDPLSRMGANMQLLGKGGTLPLRLQGQGTTRLQGMTHRCEVASAQVKSAILLAGLQAEGSTEVIETVPTRDHSERMLKAMGAPIHIFDGCTSIRRGALSGISITIGGDFSSAAYWLALGVLHRTAKLRIQNVNVNPTRTGFLEVLRRMGACITVQPCGGEIEPTAMIEAQPSELRGLEIGACEAASMIDELPLLAVVATQAQGSTSVRGAGELRVKESDRIAGMVAMLRAMGAAIEECDDGFTVHGPTPLRGAMLQGYGDHRILMSLAVAACIAHGESEIANPEWVDISYPGFFSELQRLSGS